MKKLYIVRHAKTSFETEAGDYARNLEPQGIEEAAFMADKLFSKGVHIEHILSSSANRTKQTTRLINEVLQVGSNDIKFHKDLYLASASAIIHHVKKVNDSVNELMVIAHNPGVSELVNYLLNSHTHQFPTAGMVCIEFDMETWSEIENNGNLGFFIYPKMYK